MNSRKFPVRSNANINVKSRPGTPKQLLNATTSSANSNSTLNITNVNCLVPKQAATDWTLQCDFANSAYVRAIISKDVTQVAVRDFEESIDSQLTEQFELLNRIKKEKIRLENEINNLDALSEMNKQCVELEQVYKKFEEIIVAYKVKQNLKNYITYLEQACNRLRLKNIKPFEKQEDYNKFEDLVKNCNESMEKFKVIIGNAENVLTLSNKIQTFMVLQDDVLKKSKILDDLHVVVSLNLFKNISDRFAAAHDYDE